MQRAGDRGGPAAGPLHPRRLGAAGRRPRRGARGVAAAAGPGGAAAGARVRRGAAPAGRAAAGGAGRAPRGARGSGAGGRAGRGGGGREGPAAGRGPARANDALGRDVVFWAAEAVPCRRRRGPRARRRRAAGRAAERGRAVRRGAGALAASGAGSRWHRPSPATHLAGNCGGHGARHPCDLGPSCRVRVHAGAAPHSSKLAYALPLFGLTQASSSGLVNMAAATIADFFARRGLAEPGLHLGTCSAGGADGPGGGGQEDAAGDGGGAHGSSGDQAGPTLGFCQFTLTVRPPGRGGPPTGPHGDWMPLGRHRASPSR
jgi:hypothetical protein